MSGPPASVAVVGGGRWARVVVDVLAGLSPGLAITVHSPSAAAEVARWAESKGLGGRVRARSEGPDYGRSGPGAVIVANRAADHFAAAAAALDAGVPVLVEKPLCATGAEAERLVARGGPLAASQVFMFARYIQALGEAARSAGTLESLRVDWADPAGNVRHGQAVRYDPQVPVHADVLPHVCAIAAAITGNEPHAVKEAQRSGETVEAAMTVGTVVLFARLERGASARRRVVTARAGGKDLVLDFSAEPGTLEGASADPLWETGPRPMAAMLSAFLKWAGGGPKDPRLDAAVGLQACRLAGKISDLIARQVNS